MKNQHDLDQLQRHANKRGTWQAKLAYAMYLLKYTDNKTEAKFYLDEVDQEHVPLPYTIRARKLKLQYIEDMKDGVAYSELTDQISNYIEPDYFFTRKISGTNMLYNKISFLVKYQRSWNSSVK